MADKRLGSAPRLDVPHSEMMVGGGSFSHVCGINQDSDGCPGHFHLPLNFPQALSPWESWALPWELPVPAETPSIVPGVIPGLLCDPVTPHRV